MRRSLQPNVAKERGFSVRFWTLLVVTGVGAGVGAAALMKLLRAVQYLVWTHQPGTFLASVESASSEQRVLVVLAGGAVTSVGLLVLHRMRSRESTDVSEAIWLRAGRLPVLKTVYSGVLSIVIVAMGAALGREGAPKQVGAAIGSLLSVWTDLPPSERQLLAACGAGAGMAAVYNVPLGGALFALEVLLGTLTIPRVLPALTASLLATAVSWIWLPSIPTYTVGVSAVSMQELAWVLVIGPLAGIASLVYVRGIVWADTRKLRGWKATAAPILVFAGLGCAAILFPQLLGNGKDVIQQAFDNRLGVPLLCALLFLRPIATAACLGSGAPGGLFTPTMTFGTLFGGLLGHVWSSFWPGVAFGNYAMIGAGAFLAAATLGPISAIVLTLELTHHVNQIVVPLMLAVAAATLVARTFDSRSIYSAHPMASPSPQ
ncbi:MAG: chloride channel protein [Vulcanimicrobiaceae bacterium]